MRRLAGLVTLILLAGCQQSFDEKYADTEKQLKVDAQRLDEAMAKEAAREPQAADNSGVP